MTLYLVITDVEMKERVNVGKTWSGPRRVIENFERTDYGPGLRREGLVSECLPTQLRYVGKKAGKVSWRKEVTAMVRFDLRSSDARQIGFRQFRADGAKSSS